MAAATRNTFALLVITLLAFSSVASAKTKPIKLTLPGTYTVIALAENGKSSTVNKKSGSVKVTPKASKVSLHLIDPSGKYVAMVVMGKSGKKQVSTCVKAGANLGRLKVKNGYATPTNKKKAKNGKCSSLKAKAKGGKPIGAGVFGRVKAKAAGVNGPGKDIDKDGLPGAFDVDDDGDMILDNFDSSNRASAVARVAENMGPPPPGGPGGPGGENNSFRVFSNLKLEMAQSLNVNAMGVTQEQIDQMVSEHQTLAIQVAGGGSVELNCTGLSYCSSGGTGKVLSASPGASPGFPDCCDSDGDGFGTMPVGPTGDFQLLTGAKSSDIRTGDTFVELVNSGSGTTELPGILNYAFVTTPALQSWSDGTSSGTVTYPVLPMSPGEMNNGIPVAANSSGHVVVTLTYWRPQRFAISGSGEGDGFVDIGHLKYTADVPNNPFIGSGDPGQGPGNCPASSYSTSDPNLVVGSEEEPVDQHGDQAADPANTLTFTVDLTACLGSTPFNVGSTLGLDIQARSNDGDNAAQKIFIKRVS